jgi:hypothetical protein
MHWLAAWSLLGVIRVISWVRQPLPVYTQHQKYRCVAANGRSGPTTDSCIAAKMQCARAAAPVRRDLSPHRIPKDHLLRRINVVVGPVLDGVRGQLKPYYSQIGRPSIDPNL